MSSQTLEKRTADNRLFDVVCTRLLDDGELITSILSSSSDKPGLVVSSTAINTETSTYRDGTTAVAGKVVQVRLTGGVVPYGLRENVYTVHLLVQTNLNPTLDVTFLVSVTDSVQH